MSDDIEVLSGVEAEKFIAQRLRAVRIDPDKWETEYIDEITGDRWLKDYPMGHLQGGGPPRLRRLERSGPSEKRP